MSLFSTYFKILNRSICCFIMILCANPLNAQNCTQLLNTYYDEVTGITVIRMKDYIFVSEDTVKKAAIFIAQKIDDQGTETTLTIDCKDLGCISNGNAINILFTDGTREQYTNMSAFNCVGFALLFIDIPDYYGNTIKSTLLSKRIKTMRVSGNNKYIQVNLTEENQNQLVNVLKCLR